MPIKAITFTVLVSLTLPTAIFATQDIMMKRQEPTMKATPVMKSVPMMKKGVPPKVTKTKRKIGKKRYAKKAARKRSAK